MGRRRSATARPGPTPSTAPPSSWASVYSFTSDQRGLISTGGITTLNTNGDIHPISYANTNTVPQSVQSYFKELSKRPRLRQMDSSVSHTIELQSIATGLIQDGWRSLEVESVRSALDCLNQEGDPIPQAYRVTVSTPENP